ncbi:MAG: LacI family DNA-binding transcriptional regulator [Bryobacteraceae bacterium]
MSTQASFRRRKKSGHASIKDVAERAGVSTATVSHVINGTRNTLPETRERVMAAVNELGYSLNQAARNLVVGHSSLLGLIISDMRNPFFPEVTAAFQEEALSHQMDALVFSTSYDTERMLQAVHRLVGLQVPGVAMVTSQIDPAVTQMLEQRRIVATYLDLGIVGPIVSNLVINYESGIRQAIDHLLALGHRDIAYIGGPLHLPSAQSRKKAFFDAAARAGFSPAAVDGDFTVDGGYRGCEAILSQSRRPTAIVAGNDLTAIGTLRSAHDRGLSVPRELSVVGFDDITFAEYTQPPLTTVAVPREQIGRIAFDSLWRMIKKGEPGAEHRLETRLVARRSTAPAMAAVAAGVS